MLRLPVSAADARRDGFTGQRRAWNEGCGTDARMAVVGDQAEHAVPVAGRAGEDVERVGAGDCACGGEENMTQSAIEAAARAICYNLGRWCADQHPCDPCPKHCSSWRQYQSAAFAALHAAGDVESEGSWNRYIATNMRFES